MDGFEMISIDSTLAKEQVLTAVILESESKTVKVHTEDNDFADQTVKLTIRAAQSFFQT